MPYIVDTSDSDLQEADDLQHALDLAENALRAADDFAVRFGWAPFWADRVAVYRIRDADWNEWYRSPGKVLECATRTHDANVIRKKRGLPACPAARPAYAI